MKRNVCLLLCAVMMVMLFAGCQTEGPVEATAETTLPQVPRELKIGYGRVDITPQESVPLRGLGGDTSDRMSKDVKDPLYATCIAFTDETDNTILLFELDLAMCFGLATAYARSDISKATGVPVAQIMVTATHNHSGPDLDNTKEPSIERYTESLRKWMVEAAEAAMADRKVATGLYQTSAQPANLNFVRHYVMGDGTIAGDNFGNYKDNPIVKHVLDADNQLQLVKFTREGGKDIVLMNWQGHPRGHKDYKDSILSDVDVLRTKLEAELDCQFAFFLGASGNVNNSSNIKSEQITANYKEHYEMLGQYAVNAAENFQKIELGNLQILGQTYKCKAKENANMTMDVTMFTISFGDLAFVAAPYEMFSENGQQIKEGSPFKTTFIATCANNMLYYVPSAATYAYDAYEIETGRLAQGSAEILVAEYLTMLKQLYETK